MIAKPLPPHPFKELAADFCYHGGQCYFVIVDCYTDWPTVVPMGKSANATNLITVLRELFARTAVPDTFWSHGGPQFSSNQFRQFATQWKFQHQMSSPHCPQSNGKAEAIVKSMKKIIRAAWNGRYLDGDKLCRALLQYRNTPSVKDGLSPAHKLFERPIQDTLPAHTSSFTLITQLQQDQARAKAGKVQQQATKYYNRNTCPLPDIRLQSQVTLQNPRTKLWDIYGEVIAIGPYRQYTIKTLSGKILIRNRRFIRRRVPLSSLPQPAPVVQSQEQQSSQIDLSLPRRSSRVRRRPQRLIEDPTWQGP